MVHQWCYRFFRTTLFVLKWFDAYLYISLWFYTHVTILFFFIFCFCFCFCFLFFLPLWIWISVCILKVQPVSLCLCIHLSNLCEKVCMCVFVCLCLLLYLCQFVIVYISIYMCLCIHLRIGELMWSPKRVGVWGLFEELMNFFFCFSSFVRCVPEGNSLFQEVGPCVFPLARSRFIYGHSLSRCGCAPS